MLVQATGRLSAGRLQELYIYVACIFCGLSVLLLV